MLLLAAKLVVCAFQENSRPTLAGRNGAFVGLFATQFVFQPFLVFPQLWMMLNLKKYSPDKIPTGILVLIYIEYGLTALVSVLWLLIMIISMINELKNH